MADKFQCSGGRCHKTPNPETRNLNADLVAAEGMHRAGTILIGFDTQPLFAGRFIGPDYIRVDKRDDPNTFKNHRW
jgi:hypothetical protein